MSVSAIDYNNIYTAAFQKMVAEEAKMGNIEKTGRKYGVQVSWIQEWQRNWSQKENNNNVFPIQNQIKT